MGQQKLKHQRIVWWQVAIIIGVVAVVGLAVVRFGSAASNNANLANSIQQEYLRLRAEQLAKQNQPTPPPKPTPPPTLPKPPSTKPSTPSTPSASKQQSSQLLGSISGIAQQQKSATTQTGTKTTASLNRNTLQAESTSTEEQEGILSGLPSAELPTLSNIVSFVPTIPSGTTSPLVAYYINRKLAYYSEKPPYQYNLDTVDLDNGTYVLNTVVFDAQDNQVARYDYKFNVQNNLSLWQRLQRAITAPFRILLQ